MADSTNSPPSPSSLSRGIAKQVVIQSLHPFFIEVDGIRIAVPAAREAVAHFKHDDTPSITISPPILSSAEERESSASFWAWITSHWKRATLGVVVIGAVGYGIHKMITEYNDS